MDAENRMGTVKVSRLVITTGIPLMLSLVFYSLFNFVDSIFVSRISEDALTAISLSAPVQVLMSALALGNAIGLNAAISKALGGSRPDVVKETANAALFIAFCEWILISVACLAGMRWYFDWQSGGNEVISSYGRQYLGICMLFSFGMMGQWVFDRFLLASGKSGLFLITLSSASIINLILDPIFIFMLQLGIRGAAIATVIGQICGMVLGLIINRKWNREIPFSFTLHPGWENIAAILRVGIPATVVQVLTSVVTVIMNSILLTFSTTAVAVYGVCYRMRGICTIGFHGIDNGLIPIVAFNFGAKKPDRIRSAVRWAVFYSGLFYVPFMLILECMPEYVLQLFNATENMMTIGIPAVRLIGLAWLLSIPAQVVTAALQGLSMSGRSMLLTMLRQVVLPVVLAFAVVVFVVPAFEGAALVAPNFVGAASVMSGVPERAINWIWGVFVVAEAVCLPVAGWLWKRNGVI